LTDRITGTKFNSAQIKIVLNFICNFVEATKVDPTQILTISPYKAMVEKIDELRRRPEYAPLLSMRPTSTVESIQGQESDMAVIVAGTTWESGLDVIADERRLNLMLSRHKSALLIFGDLYATGSLLKREEGEDMGLAALGKVRVQATDGQVPMVKPNMLRRVLDMLYRGNRVVTIEAEQIEEGGSFEKE
jgi:hypothetical protein